MDDELEETLVWKQMAVEVTYSHDNDNFQLRAIVDSELEFLGEFDKSSEAVNAAQEWLAKQEPAKESEMIYSFHQNNSGGYYTAPAKNIIVVDAKSEDQALETAKKAGLYLNGVSMGMDCDCCGDRWHNMAYEFDTIEEAKDQADQMDFGGGTSIPQYMITDDLDWD